MFIASYNLTLDSELQLIKTNPYLKKEDKKVFYAL